ncbi:MAG TPA: hybrid sensor histidine kinase/response regulator, partial [Thiolapillus brandeum]|nr:hybrid sensor histidine kinase/response regulator [Thiolapillus brandeum]
MEMTEKGLILIVDDVEINRELVARFLQRKGYQTVQACGGRDALELIAAQPFDMVLLDIMMPEMDGWEVLRVIRKTHAPAALPVIMLTARQESGDVVESLRQGANDYVTKPIDFPVLLARMKVHLGLKRAEQRLQTINETLEQQVAERTAQLDRINHTYQTLSNVNQALLRADTEEGLLQQVCRIVSDDANYVFALVGYA